MSDAMLHTIDGRARPHDLVIASVSHFDLDAGRSVSPQIVVDETTWTPYCIDHAQRQMIFVDVPQEVDLSEAVFVNLTQFHEARRVLLVDYDDLPQLAEQIAAPQNTIFVFNLPRSGTTLASRMLNQIDDVWSLSEPDVFTHLNMLRPLGVSDDEIRALVQCSTRLMFRPPGNTPPATYAIKFRSETTAIADLFYQEFPGAKYLYLYRDALNFGNSFYQLVQRAADAPAFLERAEVEQYWPVLANHSDTSYLEALVQRSLDKMPAEEFLAAMYCAKIEHYVTSYEQGVPYCGVRYNEWNMDRETETSRMLQHCGLPAEALPQAMRAFERDSQAGTTIARDVEAAKFTEAQTERYLRILARHPRFSDPDLLLPDIYHPDRAI